VRVALRLASLGLILTACVPSGVSRDEATNLAVEAAGPGSSVSSAEQGALGEFVDPRTVPELRRDRGVWAIALAGDFPGECVTTATGVSQCPPVANTALVVLDDQTGEILLIEVPAR
jgi:hypothetical protein